MFTALEVENFRGIERLSVGGLGRVNLIIGKNNAGKTALMEAAIILAFPEHAGAWVPETRSNTRDDDPYDFETYWRPIFRGGDAERGLLFRATMAQGVPIKFSMRKAHLEQVIEGKIPANSRTLSRSSSWALDCKLTTGSHVRDSQIAKRPDGSLILSELDSISDGWWVSSSAPKLHRLIKWLSDLKQGGDDARVRDLLRQLDERIESLEILSPSGQLAELFVRVAGESKLLPFKAMGDGVQRSLEIAIGLVMGKFTQICIDEFENGLHHSVLQPLWTWLARISTSRDVQVFATTHSEECVQAACRAFSSLNDDGLRVIRLDRQEHQTVATVYDRQLVEAAGSMGVELRG